MIINQNLLNSINSLSFIEELYSDTIEYITDESNSPGVWVGNDREYKKINIKDTIKGVSWTYGNDFSIDNGEMTSKIEVYFIVNTLRSKITRNEIIYQLISLLNGLGKDFSIETDASRALSRYTNFFELNKQIGKVPYLVFRIDYEKVTNICL